MNPILGVVTAQMMQTGTAVAQDVAAAQSVCRQFEAQLFTTMMKEMRRSLPQGGSQPRSEGTKLYEEMLDSRLAEQLAQRPDPGLAAAVYRMMQRQTGAEK